MTERRALGGQETNTTFPAKIMELLARPRLMDLPENPVGQALEVLRRLYPDFTDIELPEVIDCAEVRKAVDEDLLYLDAQELHFVGTDRTLRYDMTLPFLLTVISNPPHGPARLWSAGKVYRVCQSDSMHIEAFHQAEALWIDESDKMEPWCAVGRVLESVERLLPGSVVRIVPTSYPECSQAWELAIEHNGAWWEVMAWGAFTDKIVARFGVDPNRFKAIDVCYGLERIAMLRHGIDDIRRVESASVSAA